MNKKIVVVSILLVFMLVAVSMVCVVSVQSKKFFEKKDSPLFCIKNIKAINKQNIDVKPNFLKDRIYLKFDFIQKIINFGSEEPKISMSICKTLQMRLECFTVSGLFCK